CLLGGRYGPRRKGQSEFLKHRLEPGDRRRFLKPASPTEARWVGPSVLVPCFFTSERLSPMRKFLVDFVRKEDGPTAVEYAVMLSLIIVVCLVAITALGTKASGTFQGVANTIGGSS